MVIKYLVSIRWGFSMSVKQLVVCAPDIVTQVLQRGTKGEDMRQGGSVPGSFHRSRLVTSRTLNRGPPMKLLQVWPMDLALALYNPWEVKANVCTMVYGKCRALVCIGALPCCLLTFSFGSAGLEPAPGSMSCLVWVRHLCPAASSLELWTVMQPLQRTLVGACLRLRPLPTQHSLHLRLSAGFPLTDTAMQPLCFPLEFQ